jgi:hypothetical protein
MKFVRILFCFLTYTSLAGQYQLFEENGKIGIKDDQGTVLLPAAFEALGWSDKNFSVVGEVTGYRQAGKWGLINLKKEKITDPIYEELIYAGGEYVTARKKINVVQTKSGCLNLKGEIKIPFVYDGIQVHGLRAIVFNLNGAKYYYGISDFENHLLLPLNYRSIRALGTLRYAVESMEKKFALFSEDGRPVTDFTIDSLSDFRKSYAVFYQDLRQGLIDREGAIRLEAKYADIQINREAEIMAKDPDEWVRLNQKNEVLQKISAEKLIPSATYFLYSMSGKWGILDAHYQPMVKAAYQQLIPLGADKFIATKNSKTGVISSKGDLLIPFEFDSLHYEDHFLRAFHRSTGWYLLNEQGEKLSKKYYQQIARPANGKYPAKNLGFWGVLDQQGDEIVHCVFDSIGQIVDDKVMVKFKGKYGVISDKENWIVPPLENKIKIINNSRYLLTHPDNQFIKSFSGEIIYFTPYPLHFEADFFSEHLPDGSDRRLTYDGLRMVQSFVAENTDEIFHESEGMIGFKRDGRFGFLDARGRLRIANRYDSVGEFHNGLAAIKLIGKWGYVNEADKIVIHPNYDSPANFKNELCIVSRNGVFGIIDKTGKIVLPLRYDFIQRLSDDRFLLRQNSLVGLANEKASVLLEPRFNLLTYDRDDFWIACQHGKCGVIASSGMDIIPTIYDQLIPEKGGNFLALKKAEWKEIK